MLHVTVFGLSRPLAVSPDIVSHLKTTVQVPDSLHEEARKLAAEERTTFKALVEEGLRSIISKRKRGSVFRLRKASFRGTGLQPHLEEASWEQVRENIYEGRGG